MADEKLFTINLRREFIKAPTYKKAKKSIKAIREYIQKHMKVENVKIGKHLNDKIWERGSKNPPAKVQVKVLKEKDSVKVELVGFDFEVIKKRKKKVETGKGIGGKLASKVEALRGEPEEEKETKEEKKEKVKADITKAKVQPASAPKAKAEKKSQAGRQTMSA